MYQENCSIININNNNLPIIQADDNFECAFKEVFQPNDNIIGEELDENIGNEKQDEYHCSNSNNCFSENDFDVNIRNNLNYKKSFENNEFNEKRQNINNEEKDKNPKIIEQNDKINIIEDKIAPITQEIEKTKEDIKIPKKITNPFKVYNSTEFNIFHPGGNCPLYNKVKEQIKDLENTQTINTTCNCNKFKVHKKSKIKRKRTKKEKIERKRKPDNIRKKIKSRFFKSLKIRINQILKSAKSQELFDLLPQCFIINITKKVNKFVIDFPLKKLLTYNFIVEKLINENKEVENNMRTTDLKKYERNIKVIKYLENNDNILKNSKFNIIGNMTFSEIFEEYLKSDEFEKEIIKLEKEGNDENYIKDYIVKAFGFIKYFH